MTFRCSLVDLRGLPPLCDSMLSVERDEPVTLTRSYPEVSDAAAS